MNRSEALERWRRIADGDLHRGQYDAVDLHEWIRGVAAKVLEADGVRDAVRPGTLVEAIGLSGRRDSNSAFREHLQRVDEFPFVDDAGQRRAARRGERMDSLKNAAHAAGLVGENESDDELRKRIDREV